MSAVMAQQGDFESKTGKVDHEKAKKPFFRMENHFQDKITS